MKILEIHGNRQRLDGGAMFGNAPRALWSRWLPPDEQGRIGLACRCLLAERAGSLVLFETGIGAFFEPGLRERYGVVEHEHVLLAALAAHGVNPADISDIVLSHLHFDHAGGLLAAFAAGESRRLVFPRARFWLSEAAWERAKQPHVRDRASFIPELPALLEESGRLHVLAPHSAGQWFEGPFGSDVLFTLSNGHTPGMLHAKLQGAAQNVFFCADLIPGMPWVHAPITMGYDRFPEALIDEKLQLFDDFERDETWLYFCHDPDVAMARATRDAKRQMRVKQKLDRIDAWYDLEQVSKP